MNHDFGKLPEIFGRYAQSPASLIAVLQDIQREYHYLPKEALRETAKWLAIPLSKVYSVSTFYNAFSLVPRGKKVIRVCVGTACHIRGASLIQQQFESMLNIKAGQTTPDREHTLEVVACVGACAMAPVVIVDEKYHGSFSVSNVRKILKAK